MRMVCKWWVPFRGLCTAPRLSHLSPSGSASMVDVTSKSETIRSARAQANVHIPPRIHSLLSASLACSSNVQSGKGDVFTTAQLAGIQAAKQTASLIPLCHSVPLSHVSVDLSLLCDQVCIIATATTPPARTGVEMEALTAASVAALTVYDMCKAGGKGMTIQVKLLEKRGGKSGRWTRE